MDSSNCRPERLKEACEGSLKRLKLERIDLYQLHTHDPRVSIEDSIGALAQLRAAGKSAISACPTFRSPS